MGFKSRRAKRPDEPQALRTEGEFQHSSGNSTLEAVLFEHTLDDNAEPRVPKGYRARSIKNPKTA